MNQQQQTLSYFSRNAEEWQRTASAEKFSVITNRHQAVLEMMKAFPRASSLMDVGCGTGQLAIEASKMGWSSFGIDYAPVMIEICRANNHGAGTNARFHCGSFFDYEIDAASYDVISAQGFIEYISLTELDTVLAAFVKGLKIGGAVALGSRNRLFNLHSLNEFSLLELQLDTIGNLMRESVILQSSASQEEAIDALGTMSGEYLHPETHPETGVKVDRRLQFSPADLIARLTRHGLRPTRIFPVHFHGLPLSLSRNVNLEPLHEQLASLVCDQYIDAHQFVPYSSSYVIEAKKI
jgi:2-polyprenyl-3-methyl-5-hydroxy-6-metoxy-1,4-benzoquinol methylase